MKYGSKWLQEATGKTFVVGMGYANEHGFFYFVHQENKLESVMMSEAEILKKFVAAPLK